MKQVEKMIGCYATGIFPRPKDLIEVTRAYDRRRIDEKRLKEAFRSASLKVINAQVLFGFNYITDGMLRWQDLLRPFAENLDGVQIGGMARWFNNNTFYRKPIIVNNLQRKRSILKEITYTQILPKNYPWKAILPAPNTFAQLSENQFYRDKTELMFDYAKILREEIKNLAEQGFKYVQLSDPALVYEPIALSTSDDELNFISEALKVAVGGIPVETCLQTFFGDFSKVLPEALDFPVSCLGIDLYETNLEKLKEYKFEKGVALGLVDSRNSLIEDASELVTIAKETLNSIYPSRIYDVFLCPNCDLEFLPWTVAKKKMKIISNVAKLLKREFYG
jgi:5-methyltetrahydropteroyltriglutamate--homocysteine methyltransferase